MSPRTCRFLGALAAAALLPLLADPSVTAPDRESALPYPNVQLVATLQNRDVNESSGLMAGGATDEVIG